MLRPRFVASTLAGAEARAGDAMAAPMAVLPQGPEAALLVLGAVIFWLGESCQPAKAGEAMEPQMRRQPGAGRELLVGPVAAVAVAVAVAATVWSGLPPDQLQPPVAAGTRRRVSPASHAAWCARPHARRVLRRGGV
mmetsp:Transcript_14053/g.31409  ORF Transcript_14053/g.31409 Transcript_14053/m.31409 type:complete len:137 (-) Transcript_14053:907-1317(-)